MKLFALLAGAVSVTAIALVSSMGCSPAASDDGSSSSNVNSGSKVDGTFVKIFGGRESHFVFHGADPGSKGENTFFTEFDLNGTTVRAEGTFEYGHDDLGNFVELTRAKDAPAFEPPDAGPQDAAVTGTDGGTKVSGDPTAAIFDKFHFVRTGKHETLITRDSRDRTYQFKKVTSYCGERGKKDCAEDTQRLGTCDTGWTCTAKHTCACAGGTSN